MANAMYNAAKEDYLGGVRAVYVQDDNGWRGKCGRRDFFCGDWGDSGGYCCFL